MIRAARLEAGSPEVTNGCCPKERQKGKEPLLSKITSNRLKQDSSATRKTHKEDRGHRLPLRLPVPHLSRPGPRGPQSSSSLHAGVHSSQGFLPLCFFLPSGVPGQTSACPRPSAGSSGESRAGEPSGAWGFAVLGPRSFLSVQKPAQNGRGRSTCSFPSPQQLSPRRRALLSCALP